MYIIRHEQIIKQSFMTFINATLYMAGMCDLFDERKKQQMVKKKASIHLTDGEERNKTIKKSYR